MTKQAKQLHDRATRAALAVSTDSNSVQYQIAYAREELEYWKGRNGAIARDVKQHIKELHRALDA